MEAFTAGTLAGAGSFRCEGCGFAVALHELEDGDEIAIGAFRLYYMHVDEKTPAGASRLKLAPGV